MEQDLFDGGSRKRRGGVDKQSLFWCNRYLPSRYLTLRCREANLVIILFMQANLLCTENMLTVQTVCVYCAGMQQRPYTQKIQATSGNLACSSTWNFIVITVIATQRCLKSWRGCAGMHYTCTSIVVGFTGSYRTPHRSTGSTSLAIIQASTVIHYVFIPHLAFILITTISIENIHFIPSHISLYVMLLTFHILILVIHGNVLW